jgi:hypothetical protein
MPVYSHMAQQQQQGGDTPCGQSNLGCRYTAEKHQIYRDVKKTKLPEILSKSLGYQSYNGIYP